MATKNSTFSSVISESPMIISEKLVGNENYLSWFASMEHWFIGQGYEDHLVTQEADIPEVNRVQWRKIDGQLCSVLRQSVESKILLHLWAYKTCLHLRAYKTCFKFWNQAKGLYTNDIQRLYKVASSIVNVRQQDMDLSTYIGQIASLKEEFFTMMPLTTNVGDQRTQIDKFFMVLTFIGLRPDLEMILLGEFLKLTLEEDAVITEVKANVLIAPIAISLATLVIGVISYMSGLPSLPTWPSHLILSRLSLQAPPHLRVFPSLTVSMMTISAIRPPSQLLLLMLPRLDWSTGKTIGIGRESQGLYHFTSPSTPAVCISTDAPLLIHSYLGHPSLSSSRKWSPVFHLRHRLRDKLSAKATKCILLGYSRLQKGYCCYSSETYRYFLSVDVTFFEDSAFFSTSKSLPVSEVLPLPIISPPDAVPSRPLQVYHRHHRVVVPPSLAEVPADSLPIPSASPVPALSPSVDLPIALRKGWRQAMLDEMVALHSNGTWDLVVLPSGKCTVGCRWVYTVKVGPDGQVDRLKARLVAKGYTQVYGPDYGDTFSLVAKIAFVRLLLSIAAMLSWPLYQLDIKNVFLHGDLVEEVYMEQPPGFVAQGESGLVCSTADHSVFYHHNSSGQCIYLVVYVDDIVITGSDQNGIQKLKQHLFTHFQTKDLGKLKYFLGIEIAQSSSGVVLSQRKYALDILEETNTLDCKLVDTPMDPNVKLIPGQGEPLGDLGRYRRLIAYESIQACQMMEELLGQVMAKLLEAQIHEEPSFGAP
ncbi:Retrovirus-related Pol polyprotein from transposon RE1 [Vitis vinifera]|uniref:Retrovirus-related Pol polyprotein from transposon RE1 n=1 Tax=Vitis vinifera TaxID=29760 RepID=A0A438CTK3_VITVI|nr:Retrovirus-related Pol polyprotein from transposon RE1 [Vitis vinifera]